MTDLEEEKKFGGCGEEAHSFDRLWEIRNTEKGVRAYFLRTVVFGQIFSRNRQ